MRELGKTGLWGRFLRIALVFLLVAGTGGAGNWIGTAEAAGTWDTVPNNAGTDLNQVAYGNGKWVAVGNLGTIMTSSDGLSWSKTTIALSSAVGVTYAGSQWIVTGAGGKIATSPDAVTWTVRTTGASANLSAAAYNGTVWVIAGYSGVILSSPDGIVWTPRTSGTTAPFYSVTYGGGLFAAVGSSGTIRTSPDGITWTTRSGGPDDLMGINYGAGQFVAGGSNQRVVTSSDGITWTPRTISVAGMNLYGIAYGANKFVAIGDIGGGPGAIISSPDGITWSAEKTGIGGFLNHVGFANGRFVTVGGSGTMLTQYNTFSTNANLSNLTLSAGTLSPAFASGTTGYTADVSNGTASINVTPTVADGTATVKVNGSTVASGSPSPVSLNVGANPITVEVTAQDGTTKKTYTVSVTRAASTNANLSGLTLSAATLNPTFASGTTSYTAGVANNVTSVDVTPTLADGTATLKVNGSTVTSGNASPVSLNVGANTITVLVTAQDGTTQKTYTVTVTRAAPLSTNANLNNLTLSAGTLSPSFASGTTSYTAGVANNVTSVDVTPVLADGTATLKVNGSTAASGSPSLVSLSVGANTITVLVTAQDGTTQKTYTVTVTRAAPLSTNANLNNLTLSAGTLNPSFASGTTSYTASVANNVTSVDVTPVLADGTATLKVNGSTVTSGSPSSVPLNVGANIINVVVTAQDGTTQKTYTVTVTRAASNNADLNGLTLSAGTLNPSFASGTTSYTANVADSVASVDVTPTLADGTATLKVNGSTVASGSPSPVSLNVGANTITVLVTAQDGTTQKTYTVTVTRAAPLSGNADLSNLVLSGAALNPGFAPGTVTYTSSVAYGVTTLDVTPTVADSHASVKVNGNAVTSGTPSSVPLNVGPNTVTVLVTAENGATKTYTVTVTRAAGSNNADLSGITLSGGAALSPVFTSGTTLYTVNVPNSVFGLDVTPSVADGTATLKVNGAATASGTPVPVSLNVGNNTVTLLVTAQDGTPKTYTLTITRAPSSNALLSSLTLSAGTLTPVFDSGTTSYTAQVATGVSSIDVTPVVADGTATLTLNGHAATSGTAVPVSLNVGDNTITVVVTAQDGTTSETYTVTVNRAAPLSGNADLSSLSLSAGTLNPAYAPGTTTYTVNVANAVNTVDVTPATADSTASVKVDGKSVTSGTASAVSLNVGSNTVEVQVTAQNGSIKTYTLTITRAASGNADLSGISLSEGTLTPVFDPAQLSYTAAVPNASAGVDVTAVTADTTASITVNGDAVVSGTPKPVALNVGDNPITIVIKAADNTLKTYTVTVTRAASSNADLSALTLSKGTLTPAFAAGTKLYTATVASDVYDLDLTAQLADLTATMTIGGNPASSGQTVNISLITGANPVTIVVTAQDGSTKTYTVTINREAPPSSNALLSGLTISPGTLSPVFAGTQTSYTADVAHDITEITVTPAAADSTATISVNGHVLSAGGSEIVPLLTGANTITVQVTAQDGTKNSYVIIVTRAVPPSGNADLSGLAVSAGTLTPAFAPGVTTYAASVNHSVSEVTVTPSPADPTATVTVNGTAVPAGSGRQITLSVGANPVTIVVTAQNGTTKTYIVTFTRENSGGGGGGGGGSTERPIDGRIEVVSSSGEVLNQSVTKLIGDNVKLVADIYSTDGATLFKQNVSVDASGKFTLYSLSAGTYKIVLSLTAPNGEKLAGAAGTLVVSSDTAVFRTPEINPFGTIRDSETGAALAGVKVTLYWADTEKNRSAGKIAGTPVSLPELAKMMPGQNKNAQTTSSDGRYGWLVYPDGAYYLIAEKDGYETYDSRSDRGSGIVAKDFTSLKLDIALKLLGTYHEHKPYMEGYPDGTFQPGKGISRAELAAILARLFANETSAAAQNPFADVPATHWASQYLTAVFGGKLMDGYPDGKFNPERILTRAEMATILVKLKQLPAVQGASAFTDVQGHWAAENIRKAEKAGLLAGFEDGTFRPDQALTRAQAVVIFNKLLGRQPESVPAGIPQAWSDVPAGFWGYKDVTEASVYHAYKHVNGREIWK
ncbi:cadherin-like beta sandwich domain-containing protein [Paenibacillus chitinolyticus]|uniref:cadherin-like beta sandwich domain-containing protein n=1 Tax=Paenibacillus chitinolyticus TaxID=79263 RepID=UPI00366F59D6